MPDRPVPAASRRSRRRSAVSPVRRAICILVGWPAAVLWVIAALLRLTLRDLWGPLAPLFYVTPTSILTLIAAGATAGLALGGRTGPARAAALATVCSLAWFLVGSIRLGPAGGNRPPGDPGEDRPIRVMFWNISRGGGNYPGVGKQILAAEADVIGLAEIKDGPGHQAFWTKTLGGYHRSQILRSTMLATRHPHRHLGLHTLAGGLARARLFEVNPDEGSSYRVLLADFHAWRPHLRPLALQALRTLIAELGDGPMIVMGDFNTPVESAWLDPLAPGYVNAFEAAGSGYQPTWPMPLPVLTLDQVWVSPGWRVLRCRRDWPKQSDHRPVLVELLPAPGFTAP